MTAHTQHHRGADAADRLARLNAQLARMRATQPRWTGLPDSPLASLDDLAALPVLRKADLVDLQAEDAPFGGLNGTPVSCLRRLFVSPGPIFDNLSGVALDWANVSVFLNDERWVPEDSPRSNTRLLRDRLFRGPAAAAP